MYNFIRNNIIF